MAVSYWLYVSAILLLAERHASAFWWPFSSSGEPSEESHANVEVARKAIPFEMRTADQKFLAEAQQYLDLSPLEACQYKVISELHKTCGELGEEELGKMSVALLNCQSVAEKRQTFQCTKDMSLAECTADMDPHVWNAYHIISNRARSVCYATRQQQFRRQTEAVVNKLSLSTLEQLQAMENLATQQFEVKELAASSLNTLHEYHKEAEAREQEVAQRQEGMKERIAQNLEQLTQEKVLIHSGQQLLANMTEDIKRQLEVASDMLGSQEQNLKQSQQEILNDITTVRHNIQQVWGRIDNSTSQLLTVLDDISSHYKSTLDSLQVINETLAGMQQLVEGMSRAVNGQLDWVVAQLGGANRGLRVLSTCAAHTLFLLVSTLCVVFVRAPGAARVFLLLSVVGNAVLDIRMGMSLTFTALAAIETAAVLLNWLYLSLRYRRTVTHIPHLQPPPLSYDPHSAAPSSVPEEPGEDSLEDEEIMTKPYNTTPLHISMASRNLTPQFKAAETLCSTPTKEHSVSSLRCSALTHNGARCRLRAMTGSRQCHRHEGQ